MKRMFIVVRGVPDVAGPVFRLKGLAQFFTLDQASRAALTAARWQPGKSYSVFDLSTGEIVFVAKIDV